MTRTFPAPPSANRPTKAERAAVLGSFSVAALATAPAFLLGGGLEVVAAMWLTALVWAFIASLALALRRGFRDGDWSAFRRCEMTDGTELIDWSTKSGGWYDMALAEENERLMRGD